MENNGIFGVALQSLRQTRDVDRLLLDRLLEQGSLSAEEGIELEEKVLNGSSAKSLHVYLQATNRVPTEEVLTLVAEITGLPLVRAGALEVEQGALDSVSPRVALDYRIMPLRREDDPPAIVMATSGLPNLSIEDDLRLTLECPVRWVLCSINAIGRSIKHFYGVGIEHAIGIAESDAELDVPGFVSAIIREAVECAATDIHVEPGDDSLRLRIRVDGALSTLVLPAGVERFSRAIVSHIKALAQLDIAEHRKPQDGRFDFDELGETYDLRVSILPTPDGEAANLRMLNRNATFMNVLELGLKKKQVADLQYMLGLSHGMILFSGPTGSGKSTSLYAALDRLNIDERKIITLEDPIEYEMEGIHQMQVNSRIDFTFASGLRSILRHDPDVIMIGEIRDQETAEIAVSAAMTGHLVFSSLHTNDSVSAVPRLIDMGIEPYLVASVLQGVIAQRLVRRVCRSCRIPAAVDPLLVARLRDSFEDMPEVPAFFMGRGCPDCLYTGYSGRLAIFEVLRMDDQLRSMTIERLPSGHLMQAAVGAGMRRLRDSGWEYVLSGETSVDEILRVTTL